MFNIIPYQPKYQPDFKRLNLEWLEKYNLTEEADLVVLNDPEKTIIQSGGTIFLAEYAGEIVGTAALTFGHGTACELANVSVRSDMQGKGISKLLMQACLDAARAMKVSEIILFSNSQLQTALRLYEKLGFEYIPVEGSPFVTTDIKMKLTLPVPV